MPGAGRAGGKTVDVAGMPVGRRRDQGIGAPAVVVDPGHDAVVAVFEAHIGGIDLRGCGQRPIKKLPARLGAEEIGIGSGGGRQKPERSGNRLDEVFGVLDAGLICPGDVVTQCRGNGHRVGVVVVKQDEDQDGDGKADEQKGNHGAQFRSSKRGLEAPAKIRNPEPRQGPGDCQQTQPE